MTSASPSITRTVNPQPAEQSGQILGFQTAMPATSRSSGMNRIRWYSGLPQLARVALVPVSADSFIKERRSILIMTGQAVVGRALLFMTIDTKTHGVVHDALRHSHLRKIAVACRAFDFRADVRRMVETDVGFFVESVDALPRHVFIPLCVIAERLN